MCLQVVAGHIICMDDDPLNMRTELPQARAKDQSTKRIARIGTPQCRNKGMTRATRMSCPWLLPPLWKIGNWVVLNLIRQQDDIIATFYRDFLKSKSLSLGGPQLISFISFISINSYHLYHSYHPFSIAERRNTNIQSQNK